MTCFRKSLIPVLIIILLVSVIPSVSGAESEQIILLDGDCAFLDGASVPEYDYVWHADPSRDHGQVKDSPAEYYTGDAPSGGDGVYIAHDIQYYPMLDESKFRQVNYDGEMEWVYLYEAPGYEEYIFSTLPVLRSGFPGWMMHTQEEAYDNPVLHITRPGTYRLRGSWQGQIRIDLGEASFDDPDARVVLILDGVDISCDVAAGILFSQVYEVDHDWESRGAYSGEVDTAGAGAEVIIADGSENRVSGTNIFRILKTKYKDDEDTAEYPAQKKRLKIDGAFYSYMSMNIAAEQEGTGSLTVVSEFEGLDSELHLTVSGGNIRILADNDGINVNEDGVSVFAVSGGSLWVNGGLGDEGDGIDSNGYIRITGGSVTAAANPAADSGMDSDCGTLIEGGTVVSLGSGMNGAESVGQVLLNLQFSGSRSAEEEIVLLDGQGNPVFSCLPGFSGRTYSAALISSPELKEETCTLTVGGARQCWSDSGDGGMMGMPGGAPPEDMEGFAGQMPPGGMGGFDGHTPPENMEGFEGQMPPGRMGEPGGGAPAGGAGNMPFGDRSGAQAATCGYNTEFSLNRGENIFRSVSSYQHLLTQQDDGTYLCSGCGGVFRDAQGQISVEEQGTSWLLWIGIAAGIGLITALVLVTVRIRKK